MSSPIHTHFIRFYARIGQTLPPEADLLALLDKNTFVPLITRSKTPDQCLDVQFGSERVYTNALLAKLKEQPAIADKLDSLWVRIHGQHADPDMLQHVDIVSDTMQGYRCLYRFDRIKVRFHERVQLPTDEENLWEKTDRTWNLYAEGTYQGANDRSLIFEDEFPKSPTPTSPTMGNLTMLRPSLPPLIESPLGFEAQITRFSGLADSIKFYYQDHIVQVWQRVSQNALKTQFRGRDPFYYCFCLDDWENCASPEWLRFRAERSCDL